MPREIVVDWTTASGGGKVNVFFFDAAGSVATQRLDLANFLGDVDGSLDNSCTWTIRTTGRDLDDGTGGLVGSWVDATTRTGTGNNATEPVADATQLLFQWHTGVIVNGRFLRGRTFIPGLTASILVGGNVNPGNVTSFDGFAEAFLAASDGFGIWHRPTSGTGGVFEVAQSATVWSELAVLRRRRG